MYSISEYVARRFFCDFASLLIIQIFRYCRHDSASAEMADGNDITGVEYIPLFSFK